MVDRSYTTAEPFCAATGFRKTSLKSGGHGYVLVTTLDRFALQL